MIFKAVIHPEPSGSYWGEVPSLTGCYSQGETVEELLINLREAAQGIWKFCWTKWCNPADV